MPDLTLIYPYVLRVASIIAGLYLIKIFYKYQPVLYVLVPHVNKHRGSRYRPDGLTRNVFFT